MPTLPKRSCSLLVRTDFTSEDAWRQVSEEAGRENQDGFRAYAEPISDPAFNGASWETVKAAVPEYDHGASVLFVADSTTLSSPEHPILVVDLMSRDKAPFRCIPSELWGIDNNLNIANMSWHEFADATDEDRVFRGFGQ